ncbi:MAG: hypothetical protein U5L09_13895 [Bacteroidales bacterium]|nr:hypothetical protein [Bacteroidales bacterium]
MELKQRVASMIQKHEKEIAAKVVDSIYSEHPEVWKKYGEEGRRLSIRDTEYHLSYLTEAVASGDSSVFSDYVEWVKKALRA